MFPFFVGSGRSGTTLLRAIFDSHPELAIPHESYFVVDLARRGRDERHSGFDLNACLAELRNHPSFARWQLPRDRVEEAMTTDPPHDYPGVVRRLYALYAEQQGKSRYADKTPDNVLQIPLLARLFPESKFVHIVRDGRDVALSLLEMEWGPRSMIEAALFWKGRVEEGRRAGRALGGERFLETSYEKLLEDPQEAIESIATFIELEVRDEMLRYFDRAEEIIAPAQWPHRHQGLFLPPTKGLRDWRSQMALEDVRTFEAVAGDALVNHGYARETAALGHAKRLGVRCETQAVRARLLARRLRRKMARRKRPAART